MLRAAAVVSVALALAGCAVDQPVSPLPVEAAATSSSPGLPSTADPTAGPAAGPTGAPSITTAGPPRATSPKDHSKTATTRATATPTTTASSCEGAVVHTIDTTTDELALIPSMCVSTGAVLRIENIGPGEVTTDAPQLVDQNYEAGIVTIRFLRAGTVVVTIPQNGRAYDITVVVR